jgi:hypothetical protein
LAHAPYTLLDTRSSGFTNPEVNTFGFENPKELHPKELHPEELHSKELHPKEL